MLKLSSLIELYLRENGYDLADNTVDGKKRAFRYLIEAIGNKAVERVRRADCEKLKSFLVTPAEEGGRGLARTSANMMLRDLSSTFKWAMEVKEMISANPFKSVRQFKVGQTRVNTFTNEQFYALLEYASPIWQARLWAGRLGMRRGEVLNMTQADIDGDYILIQPKTATNDTWPWQAKDRECRAVPILGGLREALDALPCFYPTLSRTLYGNLLSMQQHGVITQRRCKQPDGNFNRDFRKLQMKVFGKIKGTFHDLKRTFVTASLEAHIPIHIVAAVTGTREKTLSAHYTVVRQSFVDQSRRAIEKSIKIGPLEGVNPDPMALNKAG